MRLLIFEVDRQADSIVVSGITAIGTIKGIWQGREAPAIDTVYYVELSINHLTELNAEQDALPAPMVSTNGDVAAFQGLCETVDEDVYFLRFDIDWLEMIDISELTSPKAEGDYISFSANCNDIGIYPYTL